jgi:hypothetical protein
MDKKHLSCGAALGEKIRTKEWMDLGKSCCVICVGIYIHVGIGVIPRKAPLTWTGGAKRGIRADRNVDCRRTLLTGYMY